MEKEIQTFKAIAAQQRDLPVWEKFETHAEDHPKLAMDPPPKMNGVSTVWFTANMEYGRFQLKNRGFPGPGNESNEGATGANRDLSQDADPQTARPQSEGAQSYLSDKQDTGRDGNVTAADISPEETNNGSQQASSRPFTGVQNIPPTIDMKYYAASRRGNRPADDPGSNRLTTGYAKDYMANEHSRFWNNIQDVAPIAGYDVSPKPAPQPAENAEVLQVE